MAESSEEFRELLSQARAGDAAALQRLIEKYEPEIHLVARVQLGPALRPHLDSLDLVQSVHKSLMIGLRAQKFDVQTPDHLIALALTMVRRKLARQWRHLRRQQRLSRIPGENLANPFPELLAGLASQESDPAAAAERAEELEKLWAVLEPTERQWIELRLLGHATADIARMLSLDADVLRVRMSRLRQRLRAQGIMTNWL